MLLDEPQILDGSRAWDEAQRLFQGVPDPARASHDVECGWYQVPTGDFEGAFALIREGSALEELVGETVQVQHYDRTFFVYVTGGSSDIGHDIALHRSAYLRLGDLALPGLFVNVRPLVTA